MDEEHMHKAMEGGVGPHNTGIKLHIYHPINLHGGDFWFVKLFNQVKELWQRLT